MGQEPRVSSVQFLIRVIGERELTELTVWFEDGSVGPPLFSTEMLTEYDKDVARSVLTSEATDLFGSGNPDREGQREWAAYDRLYLAGLPFTPRNEDPVRDALRQPRPTKPIF